jgi:hypothetical protein
MKGAVGLDERLIPERVHRQLASLKLLVEDL